MFYVYPEAVAMMSGSVFWAIIFFLMLITLGKRLLVITGYSVKTAIIMIVFQSYVFFKPIIISLHIAST